MGQRTHKYDEKGQLVYIEHGKGPMEWDTSTEFIYDAKGRLKLIKHNTPPVEFNQKNRIYLRIIAHKHLV